MFKLTTRQCINEWCGCIKRRNEKIRLTNYLSADDKARVPAGGALAVDRHDFSGYITETLRNHPVINEEINSIPEGYTIIATGPLTTENLTEIVDITGGSTLFL